MLKILVFWCLVGLMSSASAAPQLWTAFHNEDLHFARFEHTKTVESRGMFVKMDLQTEIGVLETPEIPVSNADTAIASWNAKTPAGTWLEIEIRAKMGTTWTKYYKIAKWNNLAEKYSFTNQQDESGKVNTDTLRLKKPANAMQLRINFHAPNGNTPTLTGLALVASGSSQHYTINPRVSNKAAWGRELRVPVHSQMIYPKGGEVWCSPTSITMMVEYWDLKRGTKTADTVPVAAKTIWDSVYDGSGNWAFNVAYASTKGLKAYVHRLSSLAQAESYIQKGIPLALSIAWDEGELKGAHIAKSSGHLVVLRGFTKTGNPIINDPAAKTDAGVRTIYNRAELERAWIGHSGGVVYVLDGLY